MLFNIGDEVRIRDDLSEYGDYRCLLPDMSRQAYCVCVANGMLKYRGRTAHIERLLNLADGVSCVYRLDIDAGTWNWMDEMFDLGHISIASEEIDDEPPALEELFGLTGG